MFLGWTEKRSEEISQCGGESEMWWFCGLKAFGLSPGPRDGDCIYIVPSSYLSILLLKPYCSGESAVLRWSRAVFCCSCHGGTFSVFSLPHWCSCCHKHLLWVPWHGEQILGCSKSKCTWGQSFLYPYPLLKSSLSSTFLCFVDFGLHGGTLEYISNHHYLVFVH